MIRTVLLEGEDSNVVSCGYRIVDVPFVVAILEDHVVAVWFVVAVINITFCLEYKK